MSEKQETQQQHGNSVKPPQCPPPRQLGVSRRVRRTDPAVLDELVEKYDGDSRVEYNLAPGAAFFGMSVVARDAIEEILENPVAMRDVSSYGDVRGWAPLRSRWLTNIVSQWDQVALREELTARGLQGESDDYGLELMVTAGANQAFVNVVVVLCDPGDEVLLMLPYYFSHNNALVMTGVTPVLVPCDPHSLLPSIKDVRRRITRRTKAVVLVTPGNPSGAIAPKAFTDELVTLCRKKGLWLVIDEAYKDFVYSGDVLPHYSPPVLDGVIKIYTMSKSYGLAGWRVGALLYPKRIAREMRKVQDTIPTHGARLSDMVAYAALTEDPRTGTEEHPSNVALMSRNRDIFLKDLRRVYEGLPLNRRFVRTTGAFYFFLPIALADDIDDGYDDRDIDEIEDVVDFLVRESKVLVTPGSTYGMRGYIRVSYGSVRPEDARAASLALSRGLSHYLSLQRAYHSTIR